MTIFGEEIQVIVGGVLKVGESLRLRPRQYCDNDAKGKVRLLPITDLYIITLPS